LNQKKKTKKWQTLATLLKVGEGLVGGIKAGLDIWGTYKQQELADEEYNNNINGLIEIENATVEYQKAFKDHQRLLKERRTFELTKSTQETVMLRLDTLDEKITAAINEVAKIQSIWRSVRRGIENMKNHAEVAKKRVVDEDTGALSEKIEKAKKHLFTIMTNMYTEWKDYVYKPLPGLCLIFGCENDYIDITARDIWTFESDAQRWKLDGTILKNKEGAWKSDDEWEFKPQINGLIYIENTSKTKVLGSTSDGKVIEEVKEVGKDEQVWKKGEPNAEGYFTLQNSGEPKVLTAISESNLEIKEEEKITKAVMESIKRSVNENVNQNLIEYH